MLVNLSMFPSWDSSPYLILENSFMTSEANFSGEMGQRTHVKREGGET